MRSIRIVSVIAATALVVAACGSSGSPSTTEEPPITNSPGTEPFVAGELISLDLPRETPQVGEADLRSVVAGDIALGLALFEAIAADDNAMISPYSIATALSMLYPGAAGSTADEIADVLRLEVDEATLGAVRASIDAALLESQALGPDDDREPFTIRPANSAWGQGGFPFNEDYLEVLARAYGAGLRVADFANDPEGSTEVINSWVEEATENRIEDLIPPGTINDLTRLVLVNAIWFKANWANKFDPAQTAPGSFTLLDGSTVTVPLMHTSSTGLYAATDKFTAVRLPYAGDAAMIVVLPPEGTSPSELAASLTPADLDIDFGSFQLDLTMPSFEFETDVGLKDALQAIGMVEAFTANADLSGITDAAQLFVQDALHKSFIALDENGTEAAAATALIVGLTSAPPPASFAADRPFLFWIEHGSTGEMLFLGQVTNPS